MRDLNGVAALAAALLWIAYLVPHRLRHRQQLLESRAEDRFSGALRVLAVTDQQGRKLRAGEARAECGPGTEKRSGLFTPARGIPAQGQMSVASGGRIVDRPHGTQDKISADAARRIAQRRAHRAASLARRGAAARRRAALTVALLTASAVAWAVVGIASVAIMAAVVPTVALVGVLVLGRRAVIHGHAADAAWERQLRTSGGELRTAQRDPAEPVTGRAYHPSDARTEVIARIRDDAPPAAAAPTSGTTTAATTADATTAAAARATAPGSAATHSGKSTSSSDGEVGGAEPEGWSPVPVPRPVYTSKATAPRREPIPLVLEEPEVRATASATRSASSGESADDQVDDGPADLEAAASTPNPTLDLDAILARRRTAG